MRNFTWIAFLFLTIGSLQAESSIRFPAQFTVTERFLAILPTFDIASENGPLAKASRRFFNLMATYNLADTEDTPLAWGKTRFFVWGTVADLYDPDERLIGRLEEKVIRFIPWAEYQLYDENHIPLAHVRMNFLGTQFEVRHPQDPTRIYATISRPFIRFFHDAWTVEILDPTCGIDSRILILVAVFQTDKDNRDRHRKTILGEMMREHDDFEGRRLDAIAM